MNKPFPVRYSVLDAQALLQWVGSHYDLGPIDRCLFWHQGMNDTFRIECGLTRYMLRIYRVNWRSRAQIEAELTLLAHLNGSNEVLAAAPVGDRTGKWIHSLEAPEGVRHAVLFRYAAGAQVEPETPPLARAAGEACGRMHRRLDAYEGKLDRTDLDLAKLLDEPLAILTHYCRFMPENLARLQALASDARAAIGAIPRLEPSFGLCHGDFHWGNYFVDEAGRTTLFDLDFCGLGYRAWDLAGFYWHLAVFLPARGQELWLAFLDGYAIYRNLTLAETRAIAWFAALRELWSIGMKLQSMAIGDCYWFNGPWLDQAITETTRWLEKER